MRTAKTLIRLGGCSGGSVFAGSTLILLVLSFRGSFLLSAKLALTKECSPLNITAGTRIFLRTN